jgi:DNA polymerase III psi subunit
LVSNLHNHRLAEKQRVALANRIKYLNAQNTRVLRDLQAVHRTAQKLDNGRVRQLERKMHENEVREEKNNMLQEKAMQVNNRRQQMKVMKWRLKDSRETRLNEIKVGKDEKCKNLMKSTDDVEHNISTLEQEEKMCVERLTYSKMMSQRVLYQLERNIGAHKPHDEHTTQLPEANEGLDFRPASRTVTPQFLQSQLSAPAPSYLSPAGQYPQTMTTPLYAQR